MTLVLLGVAAGMLTTISGFGGGMMLVAALAVLWDPIAALTVTSIALLVGNGQRLWMYRRTTSLRVAGPLLLGALPGSLAGATLAVAIPPVAVQIAIVATTLLAVARAIFGWTFTPPKNALFLSGAVIGAIAATTGGAGVLIGPLILATGVIGDRYIGTMALVATTMHIGRLSGYALNGQVDSSIIVAAAILAGSLVAGNLLGRAVRGKLTAARLRVVEYAAPVVCATVAFAGLVA